MHSQLLPPYLPRMKDYLEYLKPEVVSKLASLELRARKAARAPQEHKARRARREPKEPRVPLAHRAHRAPPDRRRIS